jgi:hypothetical protein
LAARRVLARGEAELEPEEPLGGLGGWCVKSLRAIVWRFRDSLSAFSVLCLMRAVSWEVIPFWCTMTFPDTGPMKETIGMIGASERGGEEEEEVEAGRISYTSILASFRIENV